MKLKSLQHISWLILIFSTGSIFVFNSCSLGGRSKEEVQPVIPVQEAELWNPIYIALITFDVKDKKPTFQGDMIVDLVKHELDKIPGVQPVTVTKSQLESAQGELKLAASELTAEEKRVAIGLWANAHYLVYGWASKKAGVIVGNIVEVETRSDISGPQVIGYKDNIDTVLKFAQSFQSDLIKILTPYLPPPPIAPAKLQQVELTGRGVASNGGVISARKLALRDAYAQALALGASVVDFSSPLTQNVRTENSNNIVEVSIKATVSEETPSGQNIKSLEPLVRNVFGGPKIAIVFNGDVDGTPLSENRIHDIRGPFQKRLEMAGFFIIEDADFIKEEKQQSLDSTNDKEVARLGRKLKADIVIRGNFPVNITTRIEGISDTIPLIAATTDGKIDAISAETGRIFYTFTKEELGPRRTRVGYGTTEAAAVNQSLDKFIAASADAFIMGFTKKLLEPVKLRLELQGATLVEVNEFKQRLSQMSEQVVIQPITFEDFSGDMAIFEFETPSKRIFEERLKAINVAGKPIIPTMIGFETIVVRPDKIESQTGKDSLYTGIVIDASILDSDYSDIDMAKIYAGDEEVIIYGNKAENRPNPDVIMWVNWVKTESDAKSHDLVKDKPLIIQAKGFKNDGFLISAEDADKINSLESEHHFLEQGRVVAYTEQNSREPIYTGIVVDASEFLEAKDLRDLNTPKLYAGDEGDILLYGNQKENRPAPNVFFWVDWVDSLQVAKTHSLVGNNPFVVKASRITRNGDIVVSADTAKQINDLEPENQFLERGKVVIIYQNAEVVMNRSNP